MKILFAILFIIPSLGWGNKTDEDWSYQSIGIGSSFIGLDSSTTYPNGKSHSDEFNYSSYFLELGKQIQFN